VNRYLVTELKGLGLWTEAMRSRVKVAEGSVQSFDELPVNLRAVYRTAWEMPMRSLIDMAADRGAFIDQSQSLNLFIENPKIGQLSSMYFYAWKRGLKTTYYLRSRPATRIAKATVETETEPAKTSEGDPGAERGWTPAPPAVASNDASAVACSLENPESCEACQ
jgi:ribonucleoside-diphosphate reductase alpha chain